MTTCLSLVVIPISVGTLVILVHSSIKRKQLLATYKMILMLAIMVFVNITDGLSNYYLQTQIDDKLSKTLNKWLYEQFLSQSYYLQPLTTWLFCWQYFDSVTLLITEKMNRWLVIILTSYFVLGSLALVCSYCLSATL